MTKRKHPTETLYRKEVNTKLVELKQSGPTYELVITVGDVKVGVALRDPTWEESYK